MKQAVYDAKTGVVVFADIPDESGHDIDVQKSLEERVATVEEAVTLIAEVVL